MNRSAWAARYRQLGRDAAFLLLSGPLSLLAFYLVVPLTALGVVTTIIWVGRCRGRADATRRESAGSAPWRPG